MREFDRIKAVFAFTSAAFAASDGPGDGPESREARAMPALAQAVHDQAYFLLLFAQFESLVTEESDRLILRRRDGTTSPEEARIWGLFGKDGPKLSFLHRLALLTDKGRPDYQKVREFYLKRNSIAHGVMLDTALDIADIAATLEQIAARIRELP